MRIVVILPTFNERENISRLIPVLENDIFSKLKDHDMYILVADDNSPDGTAEEVKNLMKKWKNIELSTGPKHGLGAAYVRGMTYAIEKMNADVVFEMDADGQHDHRKIPEFVKKIEEGCDMVIGTRYSDGGSIPANWPLQRKMFSVCANILIRTVFGRFYIHDWTGGFRALKKEVFLKEKKNLTEFRGYTFQVSFLHKAIQDGFKIGEVPFHFTDRTLGDSKIAPAEYIFNVLRYVFGARIREVLRGSFGKFLVVGGIGFIINAVLYEVFARSTDLPLAVANTIAAQFAIFSNYNLNNLWTFKDSKAKTPFSYFFKMLQFYTTSNLGVVFIQSGIIFLGETLFGGEGRILYVIPLHTFYFLVGTFFLLIWNFTMYRFVIWKRKHH